MTIKVKYQPSIYKPSINFGDVARLNYSLHIIRLTGEINRLALRGKRIPEVGNDFLTKSMRFDAWLCGLERPF